MRGTLLEYDWQTQTGVISGNDDGSRYRFDAADWRESTQPTRGITVDFVPNGDRATDIYRLAAAVGSGERSKIAAGLLALFLGFLGIHKFYLGYTGPGVVMLVISLVSIPLMLVLVGFLMIAAINIVAFVEFILYITKTDEQFHEIYVVNKRPWF